MDFILERKINVFNGTLFVGKIDEKKALIRVTGNHLSVDDFKNLFLGKFDVTFHNDVYYKAETEAEISYKVSVKCPITPKDLPPVRYEFVTESFEEYCNLKFIPKSTENLTLQHFSNDYSIFSTEDQKLITIFNSQVGYRDFNNHDLLVEAREKSNEIFKKLFGDVNLCSFVVYNGKKTNFYFETVNIQTYLFFPLGSLFIDTYLKNLSTHKKYYELDLCYIKPIYENE